MCNCIDELLKLTKEKYPDFLNIRLHSGSGILLDSGKKIYYYNLVYNKKNIKRDYEIQVIMNYCPLCGKKFCEDEKEKEGIDYQQALKELEEDDKKEKFIPTEDLVKLVQEYMIKPDNEVLGVLQELEKINTEVEDEKENIKHIITEEVEDLITSIAKRTFRIAKSIPVTVDNKFSPDICLEFIRRLGVDPYNTNPVLQQLYKEFFDFIAITDRERSWGKITLDNSEIKLILKKDAFVFPDLLSFN